MMLIQLPLALITSDPLFLMKLDRRRSPPSSASVCRA